MNKRFENKVVIVTGGASGMGLEVARRFVAEGAKVVIGGRDEAKLWEAAKLIDPQGANVRTVAGDIAKPQTAKELVSMATESFGGVDILINNAGIFNPKPFLELSEAEYDKFVDIILKGKFFMAQEAAKAMQKRGGGAIVQTGSLWALQAIAATPSSAYSAANAGVHALTHNLAIELASSNIRINTVAPAVIETPIYGTFMSEEQVKDTLPTFNNFHPIGRNGQPKDVAEAMLFLASEAASFITGTVLPVDGGVMAGH
ncbi:NAD(P)-dependent dehydrogenase, short-chain alcohol dehydrogenase family [Pasteurella testudinis DSM 23072]|uniref:NAD(P)-dependent dehydrogenase, short-chain alcohol dehydrogenase family n=1 Tax=Pasteurella testudinis DSM 23072 TaxID=1122938 RepID=A0A1W1V835_9PAST|nr:SDR family NAD(P)-dependent oxidoreductase [Pasteurella testudinis]SMB89154.1 NAD(P)-dependent dehydrogenase, short-chain alcohol dehydrogenase family [Pasteurella testudinis DSM 23072]SUB52982.1 gluconate 5-dehydrogenase [Pasteurella testudinis]